MKETANPISTVKRIQDRIESVLTTTPLTLNDLKQATRTGQNIRPEKKEDWDAQFQLGLLGLTLRNKISRKGNVYQKEKQC